MNANKIINGTFGEVWCDGEYLALQPDYKQR